MKTNKQKLELKNTHPLERLLSPFTNEMIGVDEKMVPMIKALWSHGIETAFCCQADWVNDLPVVSNGRNHPYVMFKNVANFTKLAKIMYKTNFWNHFAGRFSPSSFVVDLFLQEGPNTKKNGFNLAPILYATADGFQRLVDILNDQS